MAEIKRHERPAWTGKRHETARAIERDDGFYSRSTWRAVRAQKLAMDPLCCDPFGVHAADRRAAPATDVDHVIRRLERPDLAYDLGNLQALCHSCHSRKTTLEMGRVGGVAPPQAGDPGAGGRGRPILPAFPVQGARPCLSQTIPTVATFATDQNVRPI